MSVGDFPFVALWAVLIALVPGASAAPKATDIVGLSPGMSPQEVVSVLRSHQPLMKIAVERSTSDNPGAITTIHATLPADPPYAPMMHEVITVYFGVMTQKALHISRIVFLHAKEQRVQRKTALEHLMNKYGPSTSVVDWGGSSRRMWIFDAKGQLLSAAGSCHPPPSLNPPSMGNPACGIGLDAVVGEIDDELAKHISVKVHDHRLIAEETSRQKAKYDRERDTAIKESPKRMPRL